MIVDPISSMYRNIIGNIIDYCSFLDIYTNLTEYSNIQVNKNYIGTFNNYINLLKIAQITIKYHKNHILFILGETFINIFLRYIIKRC